VSGLPEPVLIVGTGLIGTSVALALRREGVQVILADRDPETLAIAVARGAGRALGPAVGTVGNGLDAAGLLDGDVLPNEPARRWSAMGKLGEEPGLVVVAVPPSSAAGAIAAALRQYPRAWVTDVASVKAPILRALDALGVDVHRYVGGHPMAGREVSGPGAARADLLRDRPWVIAPHEGAAVESIAAVRELVRTTGALPIVMTAGDHDRAVAVVSHTPQVLSSLLAARLLDSSEAAVSIAGQGLRDMTRIAASDPGLWVEILTANAGPLTDVLSALRRDLDTLLQALGSPELGKEEILADALVRGNQGHDRVPGKHGAAATPTGVVAVAVPDEPGQLGRLFAAVADAGCSVEDVRIEHVLGRPTGVVEISVAMPLVGKLSATLGAQGWDVRA
jgi:prephenate dehydrogenase